MKKVFDRLWIIACVLAVLILFRAGSIISPSGDSVDPTPYEPTLLSFFMFPCIGICVFSILIDLVERDICSFKRLILIRVQMILSLLAVFFGVILKYYMTGYIIDIFSYISSIASISLLLISLAARIILNSAMLYCPKLAHSSFDCCVSIYSTLTNIGLRQKNNCNEFLYHYIVATIFRICEIYIDLSIWNLGNKKKRFKSCFEKHFHRLCDRRNGSQECPSLSQQYKTISQKISPLVDELSKKYLKEHSIHIEDFPTQEFCNDFFDILSYNGFAFDTANKNCILQDISNDCLQCMKDEWQHLIEKKNGKYYDLFY